MLSELFYSSNRPEIHFTWPTFEPTQTAVFILATFFSLCFVREIKSPKIKVSKNQLRQSFKANFSLFLFNSVIMNLISATSLLVVAQFHVFNGLLTIVSSFTLKTLIALISLDLLLYAWHRACHHYDCFWMFHKVHHNDPSVNVSTGFRIHLFEISLTFFLKAMWILLLGIDELIVLISEVTTTLFVMFHHTNTTFKGEKQVGFLFTTPSLHRCHHSIERSQHDANYGAILSLWDRLFGTFKEEEPVMLGIKGDSPLDFVELLKFGFTIQAPAIPDNVHLNLDAMIAEAAFYRAEKQNFAPDQDLNNWLEAKEEILRMLHTNSGNKTKQSKTIYQSWMDSIKWLNCNVRFNFKH
jgi:sterol desaturase/sphingolipid hydroxylase (fatty acid hydroxylase superfamily)